MDETEKYQQRVQAIAEKRRIKEEEENVRRQSEEERLKLAQHKRKCLREQWLMEATSSNVEDPELKPVFPTSPTAKQSAEETQSSERDMKKAEKTEDMDEEASQTGENEPSVCSADNIEKPLQVYVEEEERNVLGVLEVDEGRDLLSQAAREYTEEKTEVKTEEQEVHQVAVDLPHHSLQPSVTPDEARDYLAGRKSELIMAEGDTEVEEEEWEMVNCSPEEGLDLTQTYTDSGDGAVLKVAQVFILDEDEDLDIGESVVLNVVVAEKSDLEDAFRTQTPPEVALKTISFEKGAHGATSAPFQELPNASGIISEDPPVDSETKQDRQHILGDSTEYNVDKDISVSRVVKAGFTEVAGPEGKEEVGQDRKKEKSPSVMQREAVGKNTELESETQTLTSPSVPPNRAETVTSTKRKSCQCCTVM